MLRTMGIGQRGDSWLLLVDTCGDRGSVALVRDAQVVAEALLTERAASAGLLGAVREVLATGAVRLEALGAVGVVSGPGSFTGVRVGLSVCKGLCEAADLPMAGVSRLAVLAEAGRLEDGLAVLHAGRDQVYVREERAGTCLREQMWTVQEVVQSAKGRDVVCAEAAVASLLQAQGLRVRHKELLARDALGAVRRCLAEGGSDRLWADANYVREEHGIYKRALQGLNAESLPRRAV